MAATVPLVGTRGRFVITAPWTISADVVYTCSNISTFGELQKSQNIDVWEDIYNKAGLTIDDYRAAVSAGVRIVTLTAYSHPTVMVPDTHLAQYPDQGFVPYHRIIMSQDLGLLPVDFDVAQLKQVLEETVKRYVNIDVTAKKHVLNNNAFVGYAQHQSIEANRKSGIQPFKTQQERIDELENENDALSAAVISLEDVLINQS